ncbi:hypothetical protein DL240_08565 [Lujinxingia litoralis]|uniref:Uncharacterized protein n=1 Tax=Lujinxingia litoralis TaxID=2211119 RepID=A0A328C9U1_9DELT|nr:hypothetical protein [Lujinxingia litoralis]RAL22935.1 hypothetical protein DL240_08565 [Lujinxingia litoralis]
MSFFPRTLAISIAWLVLCFSATAAAQGEDPNYERMLELSDEATREVLDGNFEAGAITFRAAYRAYADPVLLKNEMIAWYRAGDCRSALAPVRDFLKSDQALPEDLADVRTVERDCHLNLAEEALNDDDLPLANYHLGELERLHLSTESSERLTRLQAQRDALAPEAPVASVGGFDFAPTPLAWAFLGGGSATAITGISLHIIALQRQSELDALSRSEDPADAERLIIRRRAWSDYQRSARWMVPTLYTLSAAALGAGVYLSIVDRRSEDAQALRLTPVLGPGLSGASLQLLF